MTLTRLVAAFVLDPIVAELAEILVVECGWIQILRVCVVKSALTLRFPLRPVT